MLKMCKYSHQPQLVAFCFLNFPFPEGEKNKTRCQLLEQTLKRSKQLYCPRAHQDCENCFASACCVEEFCVSCDPRQMDRGPRSAGLQAKCPPIGAVHPQHLFVLQSGRRWPSGLVDVPCSSQRGGLCPAAVVPPLKLPKKGDA